MKNNLLRKLAQKFEYQTLYSRAKELNLELFQNNSNLSYIQILFLHYLEMYHNLYIDLATNEDYINSEVIKDDIRCDAYLYYKSYKSKHKIDLESNSPKKSNSNLPSIRFTSPKNKTGR